MTSRYNTGDGQLDRSIQDILRAAGATDNVELLEQMMVTVVKLVQDGADLGDLKIINSSLKEMRYAFKVMKPYQRVRKCAVFGSARCQPDTADYQQACRFSELISEAGYMVITGAGHGIMEAGNRGAGRENSFGLNIRLPFEQTANPYIADDEKLINFKYFFTRKLAFMKDTHAVVCCPGGFGTHDEGLEVLTLIQTGKSHMVPVVFLHPEESEFWTDWHAYNTQRLLRRGMISPADLSLYKVTSSAQEACEEIKRFYRRFHSMRYIRGMLVVRLESGLSDEEIANLNEDFSDLLKSGVIERTKALPEEQDQTISHLPRLKFAFRRRAYGRLREFVDRLNSFELPDDCSTEVPEVGAGGQIPSETDTGNGD